MRHRVSPLVALLAVPALALAACAGTSSPSPAATPSPVGQATASPASPDLSPAGSPVMPGASPSGGVEGSGQIEIVGVEYAFQNVPATADVGTTFSFRNDGQELHEMVIVRRNPGVEQSFEELLQMPQEEVMDLVTILPAVIAEPGVTAEQTVTVEEPGAHLMVCFIPVGMTAMPTGTPDPSEMGPPHFTQGMLAEFSVE